MPSVKLVIVLPVDDDIDLLKAKLLAPCMALSSAISKVVLPTLPSSTSRTMM